MEKVLFICTGNSARSQMAEGFLRNIAGDQFEVFSAGTQPKDVRPEAIQVMDEIGVDISEQYPKHVDNFLGLNFDYVITVCDSAKEACPVFPDKVERLHWSFPDPAAVQGGEKEQLAVFRKVRDQIRLRIGEFLKEQQRRVS